jgi:hypothetical protein
MSEEMRWVTIGRDGLPGVIAEGVVPKDARSVDSPLNRAEDVFVGFAAPLTSSAPVVVALNATTTRDTLAWLAAYSGTSFPISQALRSFSTEDWGNISSQMPDRRWDRDLQWPSIILGELLGQGEYSPSIDAVAISRANACYSFACARVQTVYGRESAWWSLCPIRLEMLESGVLFVKRAISVRDLLPIWSEVDIQDANGSMFRQVLETVMGLVEEGEARHASHLPVGAVTLDAQALGTGQMESRVRAFHALLHSLRGAVNDSNSGATAMLVAGAAIMVGNGTSHIALLEEFGKRIPAVFAWFGLFAAEVGPKGWDPSWNRAANSVARLMRARVSVIDAPAFDLSWVEYDFVRGVAKPREFLRHIPKLYPRLLSVEVVPGASCQFRINDEPADASTLSPRVRENARESTASLASAHAVTRSLLELEHLLTSSRALVQRTLSSIGEAAQPELFGPEKKTPRRGKAAKSDE